MQKYLIFFLVISLTNCSDYRQFKNNKAPNIKLGLPTEQNWTSSNEINDSLPILKAGWISQFNDPQITIIANQIINNNQDLAVALANMQSAEASAKKAGASLKPSADLNIGSNSGGNADSSKVSNSYGVSADISWEADIWGRLSAQQKQATESFKASQEDFIATRESLIAQGVKAYLFAIEAYQQRMLAEETRDSYEKDLKINESFFNAGSKTKQDVYISKANLAEAENNLVNATNAYVEALRSLEVLLGRYPTGKYAIAQELPAEPAPISAGIPSDILENRPDLRAAERQVASSFNATTMAKAAKLPRISLTSSVGGSSDDLKELSDPTNLFWNLASNLLVPLFDGGALQADVEISEANQKSAIAAYQSASLDAFNDVETSLNDEATYRQNIKLLEVNFEQAKLAYEFANSKYIQGSGSILDVNQLKRSMYSAESELISARQSLLSERVNLYLALGITAFADK